jgi:hypothetical protein
MPQAPIFQSIFDVPWAELPPVMQKHYAVRADSEDRVVASGTMNIKQSRFIRFLSPLIKVFGALVPYEGKDIPVTVAFYSGRGSKVFHYDRVFNFADRPPFRFHSKVEQVSGHETVEFMRFGIGWRAAYRVNGKHVTFSHRGYVWRICGVLLPVPLAWVIGRGAA